MQDNITKLSPEEVEKMVTIAAKMRDGFFEDHPNYGAMLDSPAESLEESLEWMKTARRKFGKLGIDWWDL